MLSRAARTIPKYEISWSTAIAGRCVVKPGEEGEIAVIPAHVGGNRKVDQNQ